MLELPFKQAYTHAYARILYHRHLASSSSAFSSNYYFTVAIIIITHTQALIRYFNKALMHQNPRIEDCTGILSCKVLLIFTAVAAAAAQSARFDSAYVTSWGQQRGYSPHIQSQNPERSISPFAMHVRCIYDFCFCT